MIEAPRLERWQIKLIAELPAVDRKRWNWTAKRAVARVLVEDLLPVTEIHRRYGIPYDELSEWCTLYRKGNLTPKLGWRAKCLLKVQQNNERRSLCSVEENHTPSAGALS